MNRKFFISFFQRSFVLYALAAFVIWISVDFRALKVARLNYLRDSSGYFERFISKDVEFDPQKFRDAISYFQEVSHFLPSKAFKSLAFANLGFCHFYLQDISQSTEFYRKAIAENPDWYAFYYDLGLINLNQKDYAGAENQFEESLNRLYKGKNYLERVLMSTKKNSEAFHSILIILQLINIDEERNYLNLSRCYFYQKDYRKLVTVSLKASEVFPSNPQFPFYIGLAYFFTKEYPAAIAYFNKASEAKDPNPHNFYFRGISRRNIGDESGAKEDQLTFLKSIQENPSPDLFGPAESLHFYSDQWFFKLYSFIEFKNYEP